MGIMAKTVTATDAKNNFGGLLEDVAVLGRVEIIRHGRVVAIMLSPRALDAGVADVAVEKQTLLERPKKWGRTHMIPPHLARQARVIRRPAADDDV